MYDAISIEVSRSRSTEKFLAPTIVAFVLLGVWASEIESQSVSTMSMSSDSPVDHCCYQATLSRSAYGSNPISVVNSS